MADSRVSGNPRESHRSLAQSLPVLRLADLPIGAQGDLVTVGGAPESRRRLLELGFCDRIRITVVRRAPMGDPIVYKIRGYHLSLRRAQAEAIAVNPCSGAGAA